MAWKLVAAEAPNLRLPKMKLLRSRLRAGIGSNDCAILGSSPSFICSPGNNFDRPSLFLICPRAHRGGDLTGEKLIEAAIKFIELRPGTYTSHQEPCQLMCDEESKCNILRLSSQFLACVEIPDTMPS